MKQPLSRKKFIQSALVACATMFVGATAVLAQTPPLQSEAIT